MTTKVGVHAKTEDKPALLYADGAASPKAGARKRTSQPSAAGGPELLTANREADHRHAQITYLNRDSRHEVPSVTSAKGRRGVMYGAVKRGIDLVLGSILLVIALPIILLAAFIVRVDSPGSPFFLQTRLGKAGKPFKIIKLRGMYRDARDRFPAYYDYSSKQDLEFCFHHERDPRVTRAGRFFRRTSIDELPNLLNVVVGDMSLVGPRPEIPEVLALYGAYRNEYLSVKPGVTCLSKITGRDTLTKRETIEFDLGYVRNRALALDMSILWRTLRGVLLRRDVF